MLLGGSRRRGSLSFPTVSGFRTAASVQWPAPAGAHAIAPPPAGPVHSLKLRPHGRRLHRARAWLAARRSVARSPRPGPCSSLARASGTSAIRLPLARPGIGACGCQVDVRSSRLRESSGAGGGARIPANAGWTKRLRRSLAALRLCDRCPAAEPNAMPDGGLVDHAGAVVAGYRGR